MSHTSESMCGAPGERLSEDATPNRQLRSLIAYEKMSNTMDIFISWSGERSRGIAEAIREWLPKIMNSVKPWMSQTDISKGSRWNPDIAKNLDTAKAGIFCLTPSNLKSESILYEAGAISKSVNESRVYTLLAGVEIAELRWPLAQFQATSLNKDDIRKMLQDINKDLTRLGNQLDLKKY